MLCVPTAKSGVGSFLVQRSLNSPNPGLNAPFSSYCSHKDARGMDDDEPASLDRGRPVGDLAGRGYWIRDCKLAGCSESRQCDCHAALPAGGRSRSDAMHALIGWVLFAPCGPSRSRVRGACCPGLPARLAGRTAGDQAPASDLTVRDRPTGSEVREAHAPRLGIHAYAAPAMRAARHRSPVGRLERARSDEGGFPADLSGRFLAPKHPYRTV